MLSVLGFMYLFIFKLCIRNTLRLPKEKMISYSIICFMSLNSKGFLSGKGLKSSMVSLYSQISLLNQIQNSSRKHMHTRFHPKMGDKVFPPTKNKNGYLSYCDDKGLNMLSSYVAVVKGNKRELLRALMHKANTCPQRKGPHSEDF